MNGDEVTVHLGHEALGRGAVDKREQVVEVAADVDEADRLGVDSELRPGNRLEQLVEGPETSGKRNEGVGARA